MRCILGDRDRPWRWTLKNDDENDEKRNAGELMRLKTKKGVPDDLMALAKGIGDVAVCLASRLVVGGTGNGFACCWSGCDCGSVWKG